MNGDEILPRMKDLGLSAWQARFAKDFLQDGSRPHHLLLASTGTGKSRAGAAVAGEIGRTGAKHILVIVPAALRMQWAELILQYAPDSNVRAVDSKQYRELVDSAEIGESAWSTPGTYVLGKEFAGKVVIASSLTSVRWDLVIVDEAHHLNSPRLSAVLEELFKAGVVERLLIMTATRFPVLESWLGSNSGIGPSSKSLAVTEWEGSLVDWDGSLVGRPGVVTRVVSYHRGADEVDFLRRLQVVVETLGSMEGLNPSFPGSLMQRAGSSLFAAEQSLRTLRCTLAGDQTLGNLGQEGPDDLVQTDFASGLAGDPGSLERTLSSESKSDALSLIDGCLDSLDSVETDSKLKSALALVQSIRNAQPQRTVRVCVLTRYVDTANYVASALGELDLPVHKLTGGNVDEMIRDTLGRFCETGGVLVCTDVSLKGTELSEVLDVFHYDLPISRVQLELREGRFNRFGRTSPCTMYVFEDESGVLVDETRLCRSILRGETLTEALGSSRGTALGEA